MFHEIKDLGDTATIHRLAGYVSTGGHSMPVFHGEETVECIIRPWEDDIGNQIDAGYSGQTPGFKVYIDAGMNFQRGDRLVYRRGDLRLSNPQFDQTFGLERWDGRADERMLRLASNVDEGLEITPPDAGEGDL